MVKGISRRVVVVHPENDRLFEQAIFIVRDGEQHRTDILKEACAVAERYLKNTVRYTPRRRYTLTQLICAGVTGAGLSWACWIAVALLF
ncbi:MAG: hypothetical protein AB7C89_01820 [Intestinibacillus sp.]